MKRQQKNTISLSEGNKTKVPPKAVMVVGAGYGALMSAEALAQSGIPLVWVTKANHFLELPAGMQRFAEWPQDLDFQFRPLYLRVTRHPLVSALTKAGITSLKREKNGFRVEVLQLPHYIDYDLCTGCGKCMELCPLNDSSNPPLKRTPPYTPSRALELDKRNLSPCRVSCPLGVNVQAYMALTAKGRFEEALAVIREDNPLPGVCGRVCHHPCEVSCTRGKLDEAVAIRNIKRFLTDFEAKSGSPILEPPQIERKQKVAVIGSGPGGLTAGYYLRKAGFGVTIFEALPEAGGMLRFGINAFRLPRKVLDDEIKAIENIGVEIKLNFKVDDPHALLKEGYDAVLICTGAHRDRKLGIPGEDAQGVWGAVDMLRRFNLKESLNLGERVAVIGGGNSAVDAARTAVRIGAQNVTIFYRRQREDMPADENEVQAAEEEGVKLELLVTPVKILTEGGKVTGLELVKMKPGEKDESGRRKPLSVGGSEFRIEVDSAIVAIGQVSEWDSEKLKGGVEVDEQGRIIVDEKMCASRAGIFAAGDVVSGPSTVVEAMAAGRKASARLIEYLTGEKTDFNGLSADTRGVGKYVEISEDTPKQYRPPMAERQPKARKRDFKEVELGYTSEQAVLEAKRCLQCGVCCECRACEQACKDIGAIDHFREPKKISFLAPAIVIADESEFPSELHNAEGIYCIGTPKSAIDLMDVLVAGTAVAGQSMAVAGSLRGKYKIDISEGGKTFHSEFSDKELKVGVFVCACNHTLASRDVLEKICWAIAKIPSVVMSEQLVSACHPKGAEVIANKIVENGLNRVILASCVCCPLEFQCISCNDQRNRARMNLFREMGLSRSMFEMINIRDQLMGFADNEEELVNRAKVLLRQAFIRTKFMGELRQGRTEIGKHILILGGSDVGVSCAMNLAMQGFRVRLVHKCNLPGEPLPDYIATREIHHNLSNSIMEIKEAVIEKISGYMGNFTVTMFEEGVRKNRKADIVCLTDENILDIAIQEEMSGLKKFYRYNFAFFHTPQLGFYRVMPRTLNRISAFEAGAALAAQVATAAAEAYLADHELSPRVDPERCRGCGRCVDICPFDAMQLKPNEHGFFTAQVIRHNCVGCGGCVGRCPVTALDMPYFSNRLLEEIVAETLVGG